MKPMVFSGLYPTEAHQYQALRDALDKLRLNDSSFTFEPETSQALGFGFRCGFLGLLHLDIIRERLEREFSLSLITTAATVIYQVTKVTGEVLLIDNPVRMPNEGDIQKIEEPIIDASIHLPQEFLGGVLGLCQEKRGTQKEIRYLGPKRVMLAYELPLNEIVADFYDRLKSVSRGYASMEYEIAGYRESDLVKLDVRINGDIVDAMSMIVHRDNAYYRGRDLVQKMRAADPAADVRSGDPGRHRQPNRLPRSGQGAAQERHRQMLWRRYFAQTQTAGKAKRGEEAHEAGGQSGNSPRGFSCRAKGVNWRLHG